VNIGSPLAQLHTIDFGAMTPVTDKAVRGERMALQYHCAQYLAPKRGPRKLVLLCADKEPPHEFRKRWYDALFPRGAVFRFVTSAWH
jgi:hypothetical protein